MQTWEKGTTNSIRWRVGEEPLWNIINMRYKGRRVKSRGHVNWEMVNT